MKGKRLEDTDFLETHENFYADDKLTYNPILGKNITVKEVKKFFESKNLFAENYYKEKKE